jgi:hypothetical protein
MRRFFRQTALTTIIIAMGISIGCGNMDQARKGANPPDLNGHGGNIQAQSVSDASIILKTIGTNTYVPASHLAEVL